MSGKGSSPRPFSVSQDEFGKNFDLIFRRDKRKEEEEQLMDEEFDRIEQQIQQKNQQEKN